MVRAPAVTAREHLAKVGRLRQLLSCHAANEDLVRVGAYQSGTDPLLDEAIRTMPALEAYLQQTRDDRVDFARSTAELLAIGK